MDFMQPGDFSDFNPFLLNVGINLGSSFMECGKKKTYWRKIPADQRLMKWLFICEFMLRC